MNRRIVERVFLIFVLTAFSCLSSETDTISWGLIIRDPDSIVSSKQVFKLGFFTPGNTSNRYLGVFYAFSQETVVWVANRDTPLTDSSSTVTISKDGNLVLINSKNETIWSTNATTPSPTNTTLQIQDSGNLILRNNLTGATVWESFLYPTDVFLPSMRLSHNVRTGKKVTLSAWKSVTDPGVGSFTGEIDALNILQFFIKKKGRPFCRSGQWNGRFFIGIKSMFDSYLDLFIVGNDHNGTFYFTQPVGKYVMKMWLNSTGNLVQTLWNQQKKSWITAWWAPKSVCGFYGRCGPFGSCNIKDSPNICSCMRGFEPVNKEEWGRGNWSGGCHRKTPLQCNTNGKVDGFLRMPFMKVPDFAEQFPWREDECRRRCLSNCSCVAYAHEPNIGCMIWTHTLIDAEEFNTVGVDLYIRLSASQLHKGKDRKLYIIIPVVGFVGVSIFAFISWCLIVKRNGAKSREKNDVNPGQRFSTDSDAMLLRDESNKANIEQLLLFTFETLAKATNNFHENNLLGRGGFGPVYKGNLADGTEIAVKRLSEASEQGVEEFMNEVIVISKLQHRNLVTLLGCCVDKEERMLIYEYMPNKSLDICHFDSRLPSQNILDWTKCFNIIEGIGRGILYLHKDSRLTIIHRDLKPSNVLLDQDWNPKISDFGMARIFGCNEDHANTARVVGTYGYMAPEYAMEGIFSEKSDVYSFGVMVLEIIKGKKNMHYYNYEWSLGLLGWAWKLWSEKNGFAFVDERIANSKLKIEMERCIQIALLCVQEFPKDRPTIQTVVSMLRHEIIDIPAPEQPIFAQKGAVCSTNGLTLTVLDGR